MYVAHQIPNVIRPRWGRTIHKPIRAIIMQSLWDCERRNARDVRVLGVRGSMFSLIFYTPRDSV